MRFAKVFIALWATACAPSAKHAPLASAATSTPAQRGFAQLLAAGRAALLQGHADAAITLAADACHLDPNAASPHVLWGRALAQNDHLMESSAQLQMARGLGCRDADLFAALASNYDVLGMYSEALAVYADYLTDHPHDATMRDECALTLLLVGRTAEAVAALRRTVADAPNNSQYAQDLGYALLLHGEVDAAELQLAAVARANPGVPEPRRLWARALAAQHKLAAALHVLDGVLVDFPRDQLSQTLRQSVAAALTGAAADASEAADVPGGADAPP